MGPLRECRVGRLRDYYYLWQSYQQNGCMRRLCCLIISWLLGFAVHAQTGTDDSASRAAFDSVVSEVEAHYAGYFDKVPPPTRATYVAMVEELRAGLPTRNADASIGKYLGWFQDMHLYARIGGKRLVSFERKAVNYADSVDYKPSFFSGPVDGNCFLIRIPSLQVRDGARQFIAKAVRQYKRSRRPYLIIDLRGNGGYTPLGDRFQEARGHGIVAPDKVCFLSNMSMIAFADQKELKFYDISNRKMLCSVRMFENVEDIAASRDGRYLAVVSGGHAQVWELVYMLKEMQFTPMNPPVLLFVCAWILCSSDPDASPEALLPRLMRELQDRGRGDIPAEFALMTLEGIKGA